MKHDWTKTIDDILAGVGRRAIITDIELHRGIVDGTIHEHAQPIIVKYEDVELPTGSIAIRQADGRTDWLPVSGEALVSDGTGAMRPARPYKEDFVRLSPLARGSWLHVNGFELTRGPDRQHWVQILQISPDREAAAAIDLTGVGCMVGPTKNDEHCAQFRDRFWLLVLDENGDLVT